jgi:hypothetical protein
MVARGCPREASQSLYTQFNISNCNMCKERKTFAETQLACIRDVSQWCQIQLVKMQRDILFFDSEIEIAILSRSLPHINRYGRNKVNQYRGNTAPWKVVANGIDKRCKRPLGELVPVADCVLESMQCSILHNISINIGKIINTGYPVHVHFV